MGGFEHFDGGVAELHDDGVLGYLVLSVDDWSFQHGRWPRREVVRERRVGWELHHARTDRLPDGGLLDRSDLAELDADRFAFQGRTCTTRWLAVDEAAAVRVRLGITEPEEG